MNIFQRIGAVLGRQVERENDATSLNTDRLFRPHLWKTQRRGGDPAEQSSYEMVTYCEVCGIEPTGDELPPCINTPEPDWKAIADELAHGIRKCGHSGGDTGCSVCRAFDRYEAAKQVKP